MCIVSDTINIDLTETNRFHWIKCIFKNPRLQDWYGERCHNGFKFEPSDVLIIKGDIQMINQNNDLTVEVVHQRGQRGNYKKLTCGTLFVGIKD